MANLSIIRELLHKKKIPMNVFAESLDMTVQGLQKIIRDNSTKIETLELIAKKLEVSASIFFEENPSSNKDLGTDLKKLIENNTLLVQTNANLTNRLLELTADFGKPALDSL